MWFTSVYMMQVVAAKVEQFEVFGEQELLGPEMFDTVAGQVHLHYIGWQVRWDVVQTCRQRQKQMNVRLGKNRYKSS